MEGTPCLNGEGKRRFDGTNFTVGTIFYTKKPDLAHCDLGRTSCQTPHAEDAKKVRLLPLGDRGDPHALFLPGGFSRERLPALSVGGSAGGELSDRS